VAYLLTGRKRTADQALSMETWRAGCTLWADSAGASRYHTPSATPATAVNLAASRPVSSGDSALNHRRIWPSSRYPKSQRIAVKGG